MIEVGDREAPAAVAGQRGRSVQQGSRVGAAGDGKHDGGAIGDLEASCALGQGVGDRRQRPRTSRTGRTARIGLRFSSNGPLM